MTNIRIFKLISFILISFATSKSQSGEPNSALLATEIIFNAWNENSNTSELLKKSKPFLKKEDFLFLSQHDSHTALTKIERVGLTQLKIYEKKSVTDLIVNSATSDSIELSVNNKKFTFTSKDSIPKIWNALNSTSANHIKHIFLNEAYAVNLAMALTIGIPTLIPLAWHGIAWYFERKKSKDIKSCQELAEKTQNSCNSSFKLTSRKLSTDDQNQLEGFIEVISQTVKNCASLNEEMKKTFAPIELCLDRLKNIAKKHTPLDEQTSEN